MVVTMAWNTPPRQQANKLPHDKTVTAITGWVMNREYLLWIPDRIHSRGPGGCPLAADSGPQRQRHLVRRAPSAPGR